MKLKTAFQDENFKLGEVADVSMATMPDGRIVARATAKVGGEHTFYYDSLEAVYNDWKDYEEPKEYWNIEWDGAVCHTTSTTEEETRLAKQIGNYFETKEEAEKAVRKLKAWKRLKDKGFKFELRPGIARGEIRYYVTEESNEVEQDLQICFGGEE